MREASQLKHVWIWKRASFGPSAAKLPGQWSIILSCFPCDLILHMELKLLTGARQWFLMCGVSEHKRKVRRACKFPGCGRGSRIWMVWQHVRLPYWHHLVTAFMIQRKEVLAGNSSVNYLETYTNLELISDTICKQWENTVGQDSNSLLFTHICSLTSFIGQQICMASSRKIQTKTKVTQKYIDKLFPYSFKCDHLLNSPVFILVSV